MVSVAVRGLEPVFAATTNSTSPFPAPEAPDDTVIQLAVDAAVHAQVAPAVTFTEPPPAFAGMEKAVGATPYVHGCAGA